MEAGDSKRIFEREAMWLKMVVILLGAVKNRKTKMAMLSEIPVAGKVSVRLRMVMAGTREERKVRMDVRLFSSGMFVANCPKLGNGGKQKEERNEKGGFWLLGKHPLSHSCSDVLTFWSNFCSQIYAFNDYA